jgi:hypothetical protein
MQIKSSITIKDNVYHVEIDLDKFSPAEEEAVAQFGEPTIACGGEFEDPDFTLADDDRKFPSQFPVKQRFGVEDYESASDIAVAWRNAVKDRLESGMEAVRLSAASPGVVGLEIDIIDTTPTP